MKKSISAIITTLLIINYNTFCMDLSLNTMNLYIENDYGADILYKKDNLAERLLKNGDRITIGTISMPEQIFIRTNKYLSPFTSLAPYINKASKESLQYPNKNAVIIIKPSRIIQSWDISLHWEAKDNNVREISFLDEILAGALGETYAKKAQEISEYNYTKATKAGFVNLNNELIKEIENVNKNTYRKAPGRREEEIKKKLTLWQAPDPSTIEDLKSTIDRLYRALEKYRARDNQ